MPAAAACYARCAHCACLLCMRCMMCLPAGCACPGLLLVLQATAGVAVHLPACRPATAASSACPPARPRPTTRPSPCFQPSSAADPRAPVQGGAQAHEGTAPRRPQASQPESARQQPAALCSHARAAGGCPSCGCMCLRRRGGPWPARQITNRTLTRLSPYVLSSFLPSLPACLQRQGPAGRLC